MKSWNRPNTDLRRKILLVIASVASLFKPAIGQLAHFASPGMNAEEFNDDLAYRLQNYIDENDPSMIYMHASMDDDHIST